MSKRYVVGPAVEIGLPFGLAVEADALYRRAGFQTSASNGDYNIFAVEHANLWEIPILLKYRFPFPLAKPFLEAGYAPRITGGSITRSVTENLPYPLGTGMGRHLFDIQRELVHKPWISGWRRS